MMAMGALRKLAATVGAYMFGSPKNEGSEAIGLSASPVVQPEAYGKDRLVELYHKLDVLEKENDRLRESQFRSDSSHVEKLTAYSAGLEEDNKRLLAEQRKLAEEVERLRGELEEDRKNTPAKTMKEAIDRKLDEQFLCPSSTADLGDQFSRMRNQSMESERVMLKQSERIKELGAENDALRAAAEKAVPPSPPSDRPTDACRLRIVPIDRLVLGELLKPPAGKFYQFVGLPADAQLIGVSPEHGFVHNTVLFLYQSPSFDQVPRGEAIPPLQVHASLVSVDKIVQATDGPSAPSEVTIS